MAMRHGRKFEVWGWRLALDTKDDEWYVLCDAATQEPVARQQKRDAGRRFRQGTNPDYTGFLAYPLERRPPDGAWQPYNDCAHKGDLVSREFLERLAEHCGHKRPPPRSADEISRLCWQALGTGRVSKKRVAALVAEHGPALTDHARASLVERILRAKRPQ